MQPRCVFQFYVNGDVRFSLPHQKCSMQDATDPQLAGMKSSIRFEGHAFFFCFFFFDKGKTEEKLISVKGP